MRQDFLNDQFHNIHDCRSCSYNERSGTTSPRQQNNKFLAQFLNVDIVKEVKDIMARGNQVHDVFTLDYYPSNYCNYSCVMCAGGASSQRQTFEVQVLKYQQKIVLNSPDPDFYNVLNKVQVINFTGGETVLQKQVHEIIDYLIEKDLAKNMLITLLTNASSSARDLDEKFRQFRRVIYNVSIDGIGAVGEYQRRSSRWSTVEKHSLELMSHPYISTVVNFVLTGINALNIIEFVNWCYHHDFGPKNPGDVDGSYINVSPVFRVDHLGVGALPEPLRVVALERLRQGRLRFVNGSIYENYYRELVDKFIGVIESTPYNPDYLRQFVNQIRVEDTVSKFSLIQVVPEWAPYFQS
jgi:MoaA/NifB/PqqE/SkfB family radical SAM enzyme